MGYRTYLGSMSKKDHKKIKDMTQAEFQDFAKVDADERDYFSVLHLTNCNFFNESKFEFGKYYEVKNRSNRVFSKFSDEDSDLSILSKEECYKALDAIRERVHKYYVQELDAIKNEKTEEQLLEISEKQGFDFYWKKYEYLGLAKNTKDFLIKQMEQKIYIWGTPNRVFDSCLWEYEYFHFKYLLNDFNWKKDIIIYYGY